MFQDPSSFPFVAALEAGHAAVRREFDAIDRRRFVPWPERMLYDDGWTVFGLHAFGRRLDANCALCPETARLVEAIPGLTTAGFSTLAPGAHVKPHHGYTGAVLRCHLGVVVPAGCSLRVGDETRSWAEGRCLVFDDTTEHEAWNRSPEPRTVLLLDFLREPGIAAPAVPDHVRATVEAMAVGRGPGARR